MTGPRLCHPVSREGRLGPYGTSVEAPWLISSACGLPLPVFRCVWGVHSLVQQTSTERCFGASLCPTAPGLMQEMVLG